jgi:RimJ/RimL family protein N-acetyltransferase
MTLNENIKIESEHVKEIYLQSISLADLSDAYVDWLNDEAINEYLEVCFSPQTLKSVLTTIESSITSPHEFLFTIKLQDNDRHIGNIKVGHINYMHNIAHISLFIGDKSCWGKGIATQAIRLISQYGFKVLKLRKLCAAAYDVNPASTKAFIKSGYVDDCIHTQHYTFKGKPCDLVQVCMFDHQAEPLPTISIQPNI